MNRKELIKLYLYIFLFILFPSLVFSQDLILTYEEAIDIAIKKNVSINQEKNNLKINKAIKKKDIANFFPNINFNGGGSKNEGLQWSDQDARLVNRSISYANYNIRSDMTIFNGFQKIYQLKQNNSLLKAQKEQVNQNTQDVILNTSQQYLQILLDKELLVLFKNDLDIQKQIYEQVKLEVHLGKRAEIDLISQKALYEQSEVSLIEIRNELISDKATLSKLILLESNNEYDIIAPSWDIDSIMNTTYDLDLLLKEAIDNRSDLKILKEEKKAASYQIKLSKADYLPSLSIYYRYGSSYGSNRTRLDPIDNIIREIPFRDQLLKENNNSQYGFNISIPIFNRFVNQLDVVRSKVSYENMNLSYVNLEREIFIDVQNALQNFNLFKDIYIASISSSLASQKSFEKQEKLFQLGNGSLLNFNIERQNNIKAQSQKIQALYTLLFQKNVIEYHIGKIQ